MNNKVTYRQQFTRCGKQRCRKCKEGAGHGPYWYAYWSENGRTISKYIGIHPPVGVELTLVESLPAQNQPPAGESSYSIATGANYPVSGSSETTFEATQPTPGMKAAEGSHANPVLRIYLLGQLRIERRDGSAWETVTGRTWHRRRARALLGCLLSASGRRAGREQVMEALWPDLDIETAANRLNGAVHEVRQVLEPHITRPAASRMLRLERDILSLADASSIWVDADEFESLLNKANATTGTEQVEQLLEEASALYAGDYLIEELYSEWAARRRESLRRGWMGLLLKLAELRVTRGALTSAIEPLDRLLGADPTHETAVRRLMVILTQLDRRGEALRVYRHLEETLEREYESDPLPETRELYEGLRRGTFQVPRSPETPVPPVETPPLASTTAQPTVAHPQPAQTTPRPAYTVFQRPALQLGRHNQSKLIGREGELTAMQHFLLALEKIEPEQAQEDQETVSGKPRMESARESATRVSRQRRTQKLTHFLVLMGESGIGKTRLAEEISHQANIRNWSVVWAHAYEQEGTVPYRPWTEILRALLKDVPAEFLLESLEAVEKPETEGTPSRNIATPSSSPARSRLSRLRTLVPELAAHLTLDDALSTSSSPLTPEQERLHLWEATTALFSVLSRSTPLLFVLDDLHWTDDSSLELLAYVVRHMQNERIAIVATCRDIELTPTSSLRTLLNDLRREQALISLPVQPLDDGQIGSLVAHLPQSIIKSIQSQAGGNPFFAEELARVSEIGLPLFTPLEGNALALSMQAGESEKETRAAHSSSIMPETITAVLDRRLSRLSNDCQTLLGKVAVLGGSFEFNQLAYMVGDQGISEDAILDMLEEALRAGLLTEEGTGSHITYNFWHPLIVNHLYNRLSAARRAQLHRRAANALMQAHPGSEQEVAAAITHHLSKGGGDAASISRYAELAANRAYALSAYSEAEHYYRIAIEAISRGKQEKTQGIEDPLHLASLLERVAECNNIHGNYEEMRHLYERVLELRAQYSPEESHQKCQTEAQRRALILREIGRAWAETSDFDHAWECYEQAKQITLDAGVTSGAAWACLHAQQGNICWHLGQYDKARRYAQEALNILEEAMQNQQRDKLDLPITSSELPTRTAFSMIGSALEVGRCHELLGILAATLGQYSEALAHLKLALVIFEQHDEVSALTMVYGNLGAVYAMLAENEIARTYFKRALEMAERNSDQPNVAFVTGNLGDVAARCGDLLEAEEWMRRSIGVTERISEREQLSWNNVVLAGILQDQGDMQGALAYIRRGLALARAIKSARFTGFALVTLGDWRISRAIEVCDVNFIDASTHVALQQQGGVDILARARRALERALTLEKLDAEVNIEGRLNLATVFFLLGEVERARLLALQSMKDAQEHELARVLARSQRLLGRILAALGKIEEADAYFEQAIDVFSRHEMRLDYARSLHGYGVTLLQRGAAGEPLFQRGLAYLREARALFAQCKAAIDVEWVERILARYDYENARV
jgi:DNA-binding SARP family transcriptional activator/predicted ATPase